MRRMSVAGGLFILLSCALPVCAEVAPLSQPAGTGSQLIFYYDTRPGFTTFLNIRTFPSRDLRVQLDFWGPTFGTKVTQTFQLSFGAGRVIDAGALKASLGLGAQQGIAFATIVNELGNPIHVTQALMGNFTVANLATASAWEDRLWHGRREWRPMTRSRRMGRSSTGRPSRIRRSRRSPFRSVHTTTRKAWRPWKRTAIK